LQQKLTDKVSACAKRARKQGLEDDLTAVIVRLDNKEAGEEMSVSALAELRSAES
jgi:hypothetical protein